MLFTAVKLKSWNPELKVGLLDLKSVWLLEEDPVQLIPTVFRGSLVYRVPKTRKRISYRLLKKGLVKTNLVIRQPLKLLPF